MSYRFRLYGAVACWLAAAFFAPAQAQLPKMYDGDYVGSGTPAAEAEASCTAITRAELRIGKGHVSTVWGFGAHLEGPINANGSFSLYASNSWGGIRLTGTVQGQDITGTLINGRCKATVRLSRQ